jgi:MinD superfamily P-loop ATPase
VRDLAVMSASRSQGLSRPSAAGGVRELVVVSGKGGTGKTSLAASFAALAGSAVIADCDVDAADMHLLLSPAIRETHEFRSGRQAVIREERCRRCGQCQALCRFGAIVREGSAALDGPIVVDPLACEGCGVCARFCAAHAIDLEECLCGEWMTSDTRCGPMVHARLAATAESSGKLVSTVRREARHLAERLGRGLVIVDGPPGIGCPVIASVAGASLVLAVTEPTVSGEHDLKRVLALTTHFSIPTAVCVNKWDLSSEMAERIERQAQQSGARVVGRVRYDPSFTRAQMQEQTVVETECAAAEDVRQIWQRLFHVGAEAE